MNETLPPLPAVRPLSGDSDSRPVLIIDSREQSPLKFNRLQSVRGTLVSGDYSVLGLENQFSVERKSVGDLVSCCMGKNRSRFERELSRMRGLWFARLLVVGREEDVWNGRFHSRMAPRSVIHTVYAFEARYVPVVWAPTPEAAATLIERWGWWASRELIEGANALLRATARRKSETLLTKMTESAAE